jgi:hypothetical protein
MICKLMQRNGAGRPPNPFEWCQRGDSPVHFAVPKVGPMPLAVPHREAGWAAMEDPNRSRFDGAGMGLGLDAQDTNGGFAQDIESIVVAEFGR